VRDDGWTLRGTTGLYEKYNQKNKITNKQTGATGENGKNHFRQLGNIRHRMMEGKG
jgi:hypothetical protein